MPGARDDIQRLIYPGFGIPGFSRLRPYLGQPKLPAISLKKCAHPPAEGLVAPGNSVSLHTHLQTRVNSETLTSKPDALIRSVEAPKSQDSHLKPTFALF